MDCKNLEIETIFSRRNSLVLFLLIFALFVYVEETREFYDKMHLCISIKPSLVVNTGNYAIKPEKMYLAFNYQFGTKKYFHVGIKCEANWLA